MVEDVVRPSRIRVIDWYRAISLTTTPVVIAFVLLSASTDPRSMQLLSGLVCLVALWVGWVHFGGTTFDVKNDVLTFPTLLFSRSISLSQIRDANAASLMRTYKVSGMFLDGKKPKTQTFAHRIYAVDLSGNFGGRQVKFWSRKRRDQFLSVLRDLVPNCRITRWSSGYGAY
jgi:hypothetical protein